MTADCTDISVSLRFFNDTYTCRNQTRKSLKSFVNPEGEENIGEIRSQKLESIGFHNMKWKTYCINALYHFSYDESSLHQYETALTLFIRKKKQALNFFKCPPENIVANIESFPDLVFNERDNPPIKITIKSKTKDGWCIHFLGILLSVERNIGMMEELRKKANAVILPLFLVSTENNIFQFVVKYLQGSFSCLVSPLDIKSSDLKWMLVLFCPKDDTSTEKQVDIEYEFPGHESKTIDCHANYCILAEIWSQMRHENPMEISEDEVEEYNETLKNIICNSTLKDISNCELRRINTPLAEVVKEEFFKPLASEKLYYVMRYLTHLSQDVLR